jgi:hypothetical protein
MASSPQFVSAPNVALMKFLTADHTNAKVIFTPGANGSRVMALVATSTDSVSRQFHLWLTRGAVAYRLDTVAIPAATSVTPTTNTNLLDTDWFTWLDPTEPHLILPADVTVSAAPTAAISTDAEITFIVFGGDF